MKLKLYKINQDYIKYLHYNYDSKVQFNEKKDFDYNQNRPYVGIVFKINGLDYFAPLEHPRPQHMTLKSNPHIIKIKDGKYGLIGLNNMIPVHKSQLIDFNINTDKNRAVLLTQFIFCNDNYDFICQRATTVYNNRTLNPNPFEKQVYCDFKALENGYTEYCKLHSLEPVKSEIKAVEKQSNSLLNKIEKAKIKASEQAAITKEIYLDKDIEK